jgi:hypothetical protein
MHSYKFTYQNFDKIDPRTQKGIKILHQELYFLSFWYYRSGQDKHSDRKQDTTVLKTIVMQNLASLPLGVRGSGASFTMLV